MSITSAIQAARTGLLISGARANTVANNVANANTPGYVRRSLTVAENLVAGQTFGVKEVGIARAENESLTRQRRALAGDLEQANILASVWKSLSAKLGDTADGTGLFSSFNKFEGALSGAILTPESSSKAAEVLTAAKSIVSEFRGLSDLARDLRAEADREIATAVDTVNSALKKIEQLNGKIASSNRAAGEDAGFRDERQRLLDEIGQYLPIESIPRESGTIDIVTKEGVFLLSGNARQIEFSPSSDFSAGRSYANGDLGGISVEGIDLTPGASTYSAVSSGIFGALFTARDIDIPAFSAQIDTLAADLVGRLSNDALDPTKTPGDPGLFYDTGTPGEPGLAGRLAINPAIDPAQGGATWRLRDGLGATSEGSPGNSTLLRGLFDALTQVQSYDSAGVKGTFNVASAVAYVSSLTSQARVQSDAALASIQTQHGIALEAEQSELGVNVDDQMQELLVIEQAYAANARVVQVASQLLDRLLEL